jgi:hypothetical protein
VGTNVPAGITTAAVFFMIDGYQRIGTV